MNLYCWAFDAAQRAWERHAVVAALLCLTMVLHDQLGPALATNAWVTTRTELEVSRLVKAAATLLSRSGRGPNLLPCVGVLLHNQID